MNRRRWLTGALRGALTGVTARITLPALVASSGCSSTPEPDPTPPSELRVQRDAIPPDGRLVREHLDVPIEFRREGDDVVAMSLLCSHQMCRIEWQEDDRRYLCPCHDGLFDENGEVVYGPPRRPLRRLTIREDADAVVVDVHEVYRAEKDASLR